MSRDPESLGKGLGPFLADYLPFMPAGSRRAGAAEVMAARVKEDPSFLVKHPIASQLISLGLGGAGAVAMASSGDKTMQGFAPVAAISPLLLNQYLRRRELKDIQEKYDRRQRLRLRELDDEELLDKGWLSGSQRLGAVQAYETMRKRKWQDYGALAELSDPLMMLSGQNPMVVPVTSTIDHMAAEKMLKNAAEDEDEEEEKKDDWSHQKKFPTIPAYLGAGALGIGTQIGTGLWALNRMGKGKAISPDDWRALAKHVSTKDPVNYTFPNKENNANFRYSGQDKGMAEALLIHAARTGLRDIHTGEMEPTGDIMDKLKRLYDSGMITADEGASADTIAHEAGHARVEATPGLMRFLQREVYPYRSALGPLAALGSMGAGIASKNPLAGGLLGAGLGGLATIGMVGPEAAASYHGYKGLQSFDGGRLLEPGAKQNLLSAYATYLATGVLPSAISGALGGWIGGRRAKKKRQEEEEQEKSARLRDPRTVPVVYDSERDGGDIEKMVDQTYDSIKHLLPPREKDIRTPAYNARTGECVGNFTLREFVTGGVEKSASAQSGKLLKMWKDILHARRLKSEMGANAADSYLRGRHGGVYRAVNSRFFNNPEIQGLGIGRRTPAAKIENLLQGINKPKPPTGQLDLF